MYFILYLYMLMHTYILIPNIHMYGYVHNICICYIQLYIINIIIYQLYIINEMWILYQPPLKTPPFHNACYSLKCIRRMLNLVDKHSKVRKCWNYTSCTALHWFSFCIVFNCIMHTFFSLKDTCCLQWPWLTMFSEWTTVQYLTLPSSFTVCPTPCLKYTM